LTKNFTILIADRNRNIRKLLQRELAAVGYLVQLVNNGRDVLTMMDVEPPDLLILDLEMPYLDGFEILEKLYHKKPLIPVIVHSLSICHENHPVIQKIAAFVEKDGNSVNSLKLMIAKVLREYYPHKFKETFRTMGIR